MASAWQKDRANARGQIRSTVYFRDRDTGETITDGTYPKKIAGERVRTLLTPSSTTLASPTPSWAGSRSGSTPRSGSPPGQ